MELLVKSVHGIREEGDTVIAAGLSIISTPKLPVLKSNKKLTCPATAEK